MARETEERDARRIGLEHVLIADTDPRDDRLLRITPVGDGQIGLTIVTRSEETPVTEVEVAGVVLDGSSLWNALVAMVVSEGLVDA